MGRDRASELERGQAFESFPVIKSRRDVGSDVRGIGVIERYAERDAHLHQNLPVFDRFAGQRNRAAHPLKPALVVHVRRFLFDPRCPGQHEVGRPSEVGEQHALHDE